MNSLITLQLVPLAALLALPSAGAASAACDPVMADKLPVFEDTFEVNGREGVSRKLLLPADAEIFVFVRENGVDVTAEVASGGTSIGRVDNPVFRTGIQRLTFRTAKPDSYVVSMLGKERGGARGQAHLRIVALLGRVQRNECVAAHRMLGSADISFAIGQAVTLGIGADKQIDAAAAYAASVEAYRSTAKSLAAFGPSVLLAQSQHAEAGALYWGVQDWTGSSIAAEQAEHTYARMGHAYGAAKAQALQAAAVMEMRPSSTPSSSSSAVRMEQVRRLLSSAASFHANRGESFDQALALNDLGLAYSMDDKFDDAIATYHRALSLYEQLGEPSKQATVLQNIALAEFGLGRLSDAISHYASAQRLVDSREEPLLSAAILNNSALTNTFAGNHDVALRQLGDALPLTRVIQDKWWQVTVLDNIGLVYNRIGEKDLALDFYTQALALADAALNSSGRSNTLTKMGLILRDRGDAAKALELHREALSLLSTPSSREKMSIHIATDYRALGRLDEAEKLLEDILHDSRGAGDNLILPLALLERGHVRAIHGDISGAEGDFRRASRIFRTLEVPEREFDALLALARSLHRRRALDDALHELGRALLVAEELRAQSANPESRATIFETLRPAFDLKISVLADAYLAEEGDSPKRTLLAIEALQTAEQARARAMSDFERFDLERPRSSGLLTHQRRSIYRELAARRQRLESLLESSAPDNPRLATVRADIASLRQKLNTIDAQIAAASSAPERANSSTMFDAKIASEDAAVIEYWLGAEHAFAWTLTHQGIEMTMLGDSSVISNTALSLHRALSGYGSVPVQERLALAQHLYERILSPLPDHVLDKRRLFFAADGALHYVPFATLRSGATEGRRFLVENHDVALTPSIRTLLNGRGRRSPALSNRMLLVADPLYDRNDPRLADGKSVAVASTSSNVSPVRLRSAAYAETLPRLPGTAVEARTIGTHFDTRDIDRLEGPLATRDRFLRTNLEQYRFIHVASHAVSDSEVPQLSALVLSTVDQQGRAIDGQVFAADFLNVRLNADLVVLSACDTALGRHVPGEGLIGLRYVILARGARSVMSSLWRIPDRQTAQLIARFYALLLSDGATASETLSTAMRLMLAGDSDPSIWGAFTVTSSEFVDRRPSSIATNASVQR